MTSSYQLSVYSYAGSFQVTDQAYLVNGDAMIFSCSLIILDPADPTLEASLQYSVVRKDDGSALPLSYISFTEGAALDFTV